jgi:hypothetical protein
MKKYLILLMIGLAFVAYAAVPVAAELKLTTKGYMEVNGLHMSNHVFKAIGGTGQEGSNSWYNMEMIINPTLHVNDEVRIYSRIRIMERNWSGTAQGNIYNAYGNVADEDTAFRLFGDEQNNFWVDRLYLSFPFFGGHLYVGRMSGTNWGPSFNDLDENRDRIKYVRKVGKNTLIALIEKREEADGGLEEPSTSQMTGFEKSDADEDLYGVGGVFLINDHITYKPLLYAYVDGNGMLDTDAEKAVHWNLFNQLMIKSGNIKVDSELSYWYGQEENVAGVGDVDYRQLALYADLAYRKGPTEYALGGFWIEGSDATHAGDDRTGAFSVGRTYEPLLILFSEDLGFFYNSLGVANGSTGPSNGTPTNRSGFQTVYLRGTHQVSDDFRLFGIIANIQADEMLNNQDAEFGYEFDLGLEWMLMDNLRYMMDLGYLKAGDYWDDADGDATQDLSDDVFAFRHTIKVEW